ncbi:MAG TPA: rod shape-determining protein MreC [Microthrixaceae bacterium]|nr:rod shape-determining protein MreC [Microthrixaceae bacterium]
MHGSNPRRPRTTLIIAILASLTVITITAKDVPVIGSVRSAIVDATSPVNGAFRSATKPLRNWFGSVTDHERVVEENERLRDEVAVLKSKQIANANAATELEAIKEQEGLPTEEHFDSLLAQVATGPYSNFDEHTLMLTRGARDGVKVGSPVVTSVGLVGKIESTTDSTSIVRLITDPEMAISLRIATKGTYVAGHGTGPNSPFVVDYGVPLTEEIAEGETIVTSGLNTAQFPPHIPVGTVTKVSTSRSDMTQVLEVAYLADFTRLNYVRVLLWVPNK